MLLCVTGKVSVLFLMLYFVHVILFCTQDLRRIRVFSCERRGDALAVARSVLLFCVIDNQGGKMEAILNTYRGHLTPTPSFLSSHLRSPAACRLPSTISSNQEPTAHQRVAYRNKRKEVGEPETELACWLLEALAKESEGDYVKGLMHQRSTMETLARYVFCGDQVRGVVVHLDALCRGSVHVH